MASNQNPEQSDPYRPQLDHIVALQKTDPRHAFEELAALAPRSVNAMLMLGWSYEHGVGTDVDLEQAKMWYQHAADKGSAKGFHYLGVVYQNQKAYSRALEAYDRAAAMGDARAQEAWRSLNEWWKREEELVPVREALGLLKTDPVRAYGAFRNLAEQGSAHGMLYLACAYEHGGGTAVDLQQAEAWYRAAFERSIGQVRKEAAYYLGCFYQKRKDYTQAREFFQAGSDLRFAPALYRLGKLYAYGLGVSRQPEKARGFFEQAAELGNLPAKRDLAKQYLSGRFGLSSIPRGIRLFRSAMREFSAVAEDTSNERTWG